RPCPGHGPGPPQRGKAVHPARRYTLRQPRAAGGERGRPARGALHRHGRHGTVRVRPHRLAPDRDAEPRMAGERPPSRRRRMIAGPTEAAFLLALAATAHNVEEMIWLPSFPHPPALRWDVSPRAFRFAAAAITLVFWAAALALASGVPTLEPVVAGFA